MIPMTNIRTEETHSHSISKHCSFENQLTKNRMMLAAFFLMSLIFLGLPIQVRAEETLATVNNKKITQADLDWMFQYRQISEDKQEDLRKIYLEKLIDQELIRQFLKKRKIKVDSDHVAAQIDIIHKKIIKNNKDSEKVLISMGLDKKKLEKKITRDIQWNNYILKKANSVVLKKYFQDQHEYFDGTMVQAKQIFLKKPADKNETRKLFLKLEGIKTKIESGSLSFSEAAKKYSQAPSANKGGDIGTFPYRGEMPVELTKIIFQIPVGKMGDPVETRYGVHLYKVVKKIPGELSLEDVRHSVLKQYSNKIWIETVKQLRLKAKIRY